VLNLLDDLRAERYVQDVERRWNGGTYTYPAPTAKGMQRLMEGRLFGSETRTDELDEAIRGLSGCR